MRIWMWLGLVLGSGLSLGIASGAEDAPQPPSLNGLLLFHRYSAYDNYDSQLYLYDFKAKSLACLSAKWPIDHSMNAHFSPDGKQIVFMGLAKGKRGSKDWDVFRWNIGGLQSPENLTKGNDLRDEDPNFAPDGRSIVFKHDGQLAYIDLETKKLTRVVIEGQAERSMPVFVDDARRVVALENAGADGDLYVYDRDGGNRRALAAEPKIQEYFPVNWGHARLLYVRWCSADNRNDQIYMHDWRTGKRIPLPICKPDANYSDPHPAHGRWLFFSSTRALGAGGYDLYVGDSQTGAVHNLDVERLNTSAEELGACYRPCPSEEAGP